MGHSIGAWCSNSGSAAVVQPHSRLHSSALLNPQYCQASRFGTENWQRSPWHATASCALNRWQPHFGHVNSRMVEPFLLPFQSRNQFR